MNGLLKQLERRVLVFDGAMGTAIHSLNLSLHDDYRGKENCSEILVQTRPDAIQAIHESYLAGGADAVETNTFGANTLVLAEFDLADQTFAINKCAAEIARAACAKHSTGNKPRFVVGSLGPGTKLLTLGNTTWRAMFDSYREQVRGLLAGGVDALLIETAQDLLQVKCAINACLAALDAAGKTPQQIPIMVQVTIETTGTMLLGTEIAAALVALEGYPILSLGMNCATGPQQMAEHLRYLAAHWPRYLSVQPNAGLPQLVQGRTEYPLGPAEFAEAVARFVTELGVNVVGGCCGTTPDHIRQLVSRVGHLPQKTRSGVDTPKGCTSLYSVVDYNQETSILNVGERTNASGSRKFKQLLEAENWDEMISLAREQVREGSHVIDVNVDYAGRDGARDMAELVKRLVRQVNVPLMLDSTSPSVIEAGLQHAPGKCLINSANLEEGEEKFARICALARTYNAGLVVGTIDEDSQEAMARTEARKIAIAHRMVKLAVDKYGLAAEDLFIDPLVLPVSTGMAKDRRSALETIAAVRRIAKELPRCHTIVGLSNVSFGLKPAARQVLNSVFLHELVQAGLSAAIVHVSKILPQSRIPQEQWGAALDLIYDRRPRKVALRDGTQTDDPLQIFIDLFPDGSQEQTAAISIAQLPLEQRLQRHIIDGEKRDLTATLDEALRKYDALAIINDHLLAGMKIVGDLFGSGQMQLPFVLQSAEVMKMAVSYLQPHMPRTGGPSKGSIVLATVKGDVHDIGKNLVDIILSNNGYTVHNLGIKQPIESILAKFTEAKADAIGLSGLLVKSVNVMEENLRQLSAQRLDAPVLLGGAALSRHYCESHLRSIHSGKVYYGQDAFEALRIMDHLKAGTLADLDAQIAARLAKRTDAERTIVAARQRKVAATACAAARQSSVSSDTSAPIPETRIPQRPFWGTRVVADLDLAAVYPYINTVALFRGQWQFKKGRMSDAEYEAQLRDVVHPLFEKLKARCRDEAILTPKVVYGYFPCNSDGNDLVVFDPHAHDREIERFTFPRQATGNRLCISDFFLPVRDGRRDVLGLTCVTVGPRASQLAKKLFEENRYQDYLYLHGLGVETAEALAEYWHKRVREELGIAADDSPNVRELFTQHYRGSRYSFGYPACPDMSDQKKLFRLLNPQRIGCTLTENFQIDPEQSTSALIVHHPGAKYFSV